jgi:hypothetical protein
MKIRCPDCKRILEPKGIEDRHNSATVQCFCGALMDLRPGRLRRWLWPQVRLRKKGGGGR